MPLPMPPCDFCKNDAVVALNGEFYALDGRPREIETPFGTASVPVRVVVRMCLECVVRLGVVGLADTQKLKERVKS